MASLEDRITKISKDVKKKLNFFSERSKDECIFKFLLAERKENEAAYEPEMLSIGPYHHGKSKYRKLEMYKLEYLREIHRRDIRCVEKCINVLMKIERDAWNCYSRDAELIKNSYSRDTNTEEEDYRFVEMMLFDGCFIVEFFRKHSMHEEQMKDDPVFKMKWLVEIMCRDMLLFENQLPFFVLDELFEKTRINTEENLVHLAISCLNHCIAADNDDSEAFYTINQPKKCVYHLLSLMYDSWCSSFATGKFIETEEDQNWHEFSIILEKVISLWQIEDQYIDLEFIKSVSELEEDGVFFTKPKESRSWLHIKFKDGVMEIPTLVVHDHTESILRNLIAFEEYMIDPRYNGKVVTDYITFMNCMNCLVNSSMDVKTLRHMKVIKNLLGNDEVLSDMFNRFKSNKASLNCRWFSYQKIFKDVNDHCSKRHNRWIANLKKKYFNSPWSIIVFLAAKILLVLTLIQTISSVH